MWAVQRPDAVAVLHDNKVRLSLPRYFEVMQDKLPAKFMIAKKLPAEYTPADSAEQLWQFHERLTDEYQRLERQVDSDNVVLAKLPVPGKSFLDLKIEIAKRMLSNCHFCTRRCGVNRLKCELGWCKCGSEIVVASMFEHLGEEPELVPSGTIFTMGCSMRCRHCQNWTISQWLENGEAYTPEKLAEAVGHLRGNGCRNVNLVGGDPTPWLMHWLETFKHVSVNVPVVWNSNSYYSEESARLLAGFVDVYLLDFKYGNDDCAKRISEAPNYWEVSARNHLFGKRFGELLIRVLVLPGHLDCCAKPILNWIAVNLGTGVRVNVMFQYRPEWRAYEVPELRRRLTADELKKALEIAEEAGLTNFIM